MRAMWTAGRQAGAWEPARRIGARWLAIGLGVVLLVTGLSVALTMQGWRSRVPAFDLVTYIYDIHNFLRSGALPRFGDTGSYGSYSPPGTAWLMLPSALLFSDVRLSEYVGAALLQFSALLGVFLLGKRYFSFHAGLLAVVLYGLSENALFFAGSLWPIARPDFYVWIVLLAGEWALRREARFLGAALAVWAVGMYVDMAILPAVFIFPVLWVYARPPLRLRPILIAAVIALLVWFPYLRFEAGRGFADIRSQLLLQNIFPGNYRDTWCNPNLPLQTLEQPESTAQAPAPSGVGQPARQWASLLNFAGVMKENLLANYTQVAPLPGGSMVLLLLTLAGILLLCLPGAGDAGEMAARRLFNPRWLQGLALLAVLGGLLVSALAAAYVLARPGEPVGAKYLMALKLRKVLLLGGLALLAAPWLAGWVQRALARLNIRLQLGEQAGRIRLLAFSLLAPWFLLLMVAEPGKPERFWWLWPLQVLFLAGLFVHTLPALRVPKAAVWAVQVLLLFTVLYSPFLRSRVEAWEREGWLGPEAQEIQVVDAIARQLQADGKTRAAIGYLTFIYPFMANFNITNPVYKVGAEFDVLLYFRHGIANTNRCAEGVAVSDEYRIVETQPKPPDWSPKAYFAVEHGADFRLVTQVGTYQLLRREK